MKLAKSIIDLLENENINVSTPTKQNNQYYCEIEFESNAGEDVIETVWYDGTKKSFIDNFDTLALEFDPDEHAELWVNSRGKNGVPESIRELINDADDIKNTLMDLASKLNNLIYH